MFETESQALVFLLLYFVIGIIFAGFFHKDLEEMTIILVPLWLVVPVIAIIWVIGFSLFRIGTSLRDLIFKEN